MQRNIGVEEGRVANEEGRGSVARVSEACEGCEGCEDWLVAKVG